MHTMAWLVGWLVRFDIFIPILPACHQTTPIRNFLDDAKKKDFTQTERKKERSNSVDDQKLHATKCNATRNQTLLHTHRQAGRKGRQANGKTHMDEFICFVHTIKSTLIVNIHKHRTGNENREYNSRTKQ